MKFEDTLHFLSSGRRDAIRSNLGYTYAFCGKNKELTTFPLDETNTMYSFAPTLDEFMGEWETVVF